MNRMLILLLTCLLSISVAGISAFPSDYSVARIVDVSHPTSVQPNQDFKVVVTAEYADSLYVDVGIRDVNTNEIVQALTLISNFHGPGEESFAFNLTAPEHEGVWMLEALTNAWWKGAWFSDPNQGNYKFDIEITYEEEAATSDKAVLQLVPPIHGLSFKVDGIDYSPPNERLTLQLEAGVHILAVNSSVDMHNGTRLFFSEWSDAVTSNPRSLLLRGGTSNILFPIYRRQYNLQVVSLHDSVRGGGWYDEGSEALLEALPRVRIEGRVYEFDGWRGDTTSKGLSTSVLVDEPKNVEAVWEEYPSGTTTPNWILVASTILLAASIINVVIIAVRRRTPRTTLLAALIFFLVLIQVVPAASSPTSSYSTVQIGDSKWRYWFTPGCDTCIIWLGGGVFGEYTFINPYWLESYNTMRFVQNLANFYSVLAIDEGSESYLQRPLDRIVHGEIYRGGGFVEEARRWALNSGYSHVYLVGYSVGGIVSAAESIVHNPEEWSSPDGVILITTPIGKGVFNKADQLRANLLIVYGEGMTPLVVKSGENLFEETPPEGLHGEGWLHKEFHVIQNVAHEIWTIAETGEYNPKASKLVIRFIEDSKILNYTSGEKMIRAHTTEVPETVKATMETIPRDVKDYPFKIRLKVSGLPPGSYTFMAGSQTGYGIHSIVKGTVEYDGTVEATLVLAQPLTEGELIRVLAKSDDSNTVLNLGAVKMDTKSLLTVSLGFKGVPVRVDNVEYLSSADGFIRLKVSPGLHRVEVDKTVDFGNGSRLSFKGWLEDSNNSTKTKMDTSERTFLTAIYVRRFLVEIHSSRGETLGGWFQENTKINPKIEPKIIVENDFAYLFDGWHPEDQIGIDGSLQVYEPKRIDAVWKEVRIPAAESESPFTIPLLILLPALISFIATSALMVTLPRIRIQREERR